MSIRLTTAAFAVAATCFIPTTGLAVESLTTGLVPNVSIESLDLDWLRNDDARRTAEGLPMRFAVPSESFVTPGNNGLWDRTEEGWLRWRMRISSQGAPHINFGFEHWNMPDSGELFIESADGTDLIGPFSSLDNFEHGELWTPVVRGDEIVLTITCSDEDRLAIEQNIALTKINVGYRGFGAEKANGISRSGSCNVDVVCPEGDDWFLEIPCVGLYTINGFYTCSGGMLNNTAQDQRPFFLTADHCGVNTGNDQSMVVIWNYENSYCRVPGSSDSGGNGNGSTNQYTTGGSIVRASSGSSDFCLVELNNDPNSNYGVTFCGWSRQTSAASSAVCIHHPNLDEKRISFDDDSLSSDGNYWRVNSWDLGTTEPGSSGSLLFNQDHQVVGQLFGGVASCTNNGYDIYGKISSSWNQGMGNWLDAAGTGEQSIDTFGSGNPSGACCFSGQCIYSNQSACDNVGGIFQGSGVQCADVNCSGDPTGACCTGTSCSIETEADCGGTYLGDGTDCNGDPCAAPTGACCLNGNCTILSEADCGGTYLGDDSSCNGNPCGGGSGDDAFIGLSYTIVGSNLVADAESTWTVDVFAHLAEDCRLDAVAGDINQDKMISTTGSFYQNTFGGATSQAINPALFGTFPDLRYDSFVTIGRTDQTDNAMANIGINFNAFEAGGAIDSSDGSWYVTPVDDQGNSNAFSNEDCEDSNGVLVARLTVRGASASVYVEALFQGKDETGSTWQAAGSISIVNDDCNVQCTGDFDGDGVTNVTDLLAVIAGWNNPYDVNDLLGVIADWGCGTP